MRDKSSDSEEKETTKFQADRANSPTSSTSCNHKQAAYHRRSWDPSERHSADEYEPKRLHKYSTKSGGSSARGPTTSRAGFKPVPMRASTYSLAGSTTTTNLQPWEKRFTSTKEVFTDFCARTSSHGIPHIGESYTTAGKIFWAVIFTTCAIAFTAQTYLTVTQYLSYKTIIEMQLVFQAAPFPAVTVCNLNPYKHSLVKGWSEIERSLLIYEQNIVRARTKTRPIVSVNGNDKKTPRSSEQNTETSLEPESTHKQATIIDSDTERVKRTTHVHEQLNEQDRNRRQITYTPVLARCSCKDMHTGEGCTPKHPLTAKEDEILCICFESTGGADPCYPNFHWGYRYCDPTQCDSLNTCDLPPEIEKLDNSTGRWSEPCLCQTVSKKCVRPYTYDYTPPYWDPDKNVAIRTETTTPSGPRTTTPSQEERAALGLDNDKKNNKSLLQELTDKGAITTKTKENIMFVVAALNHTDRVNVSHTKEEFIMRCSFNGKDCDLDSDFRLHQDPMYGNCFTFNYEETVVRRNTRAGPMYGLRLLLDVQQKEYLPYTEAAGVKIIVHVPNEEPFPDTFGYNAPVGFISSFGLKTKEIFRMGRPYTNCTMATKRMENYIFDEWYSSEGCYRSCFQHQVSKACGCGDPRYPMVHNMRPCYAFNAEERSCLANFSKQHTSFEKMDCVCEQPCNEKIYESAYASAAWPADNFLVGDATCINVNVSYMFPREESPIGDCPSQDDNSSESCTEHFRKNTAYIEVYYEQLNYEILRETEAYSFVNLVADFGGNIGLWIGFSIITMIEILELCVELFYLCYFRGKREEEKKRRLRMYETNKIRSKKFWVSKGSQGAFALTELWCTTGLRKQVVRNRQTRYSLHTCHIRARERMRQNLQYLNRFTELTSVATQGAAGANDDEEEEVLNEPPDLRRQANYLPPAQVLGEDIAQGSM